MLVFIYSLPLRPKSRAGFWFPNRIFLSKAWIHWSDLSEYDSKSKPWLQALTLIKFTTYTISSTLTELDPSLSIKLKLFSISVFRSSRESFRIAEVVKFSEAMFNFYFSLSLSSRLDSKSLDSEAFKDWVSTSRDMNFGPRCIWTTRPIHS